MLRDAGSQTLVCVAPTSEYTHLVTIKQNKSTTPQGHGALNPLPWVDAYTDHTKGGWLYLFNALVVT